LQYGDTRSYRPLVNDITDKWNFQHQIPETTDTGPPGDLAANVMPDLARAMKTNPLLKVQVNAGYFDLLTPYFQGKYEMRHLPIPADVRKNIEYRCYRSGHMVYLAHEALTQLHDNVADFIDRTSNQPARPRAAKTNCASDR
jgi:carboxypeptidase C (cathepsin A)